MALAVYGKSLKENPVMDIENPGVLILDLDSDIDNLDFNYPVGQLAFVIESEDRWMMNASGSWQKIGTSSTIDPPSPEAETDDAPAEDPVDGEGE